MSPNELNSIILLKMEKDGGPFHAGHIQMPLISRSEVSGRVKYPAWSSQAIMGRCWSGGSCRGHHSVVIWIDKATGAEV